MPYKIDLVDVNRSIEVESDIYISPEDPRLARALVRLAVFNVLVPLSILKVIRNPLDDKEYDYSFHSKDARDWKQKVFITAGIEASSTYDVKSRFGRSETTGHLLLFDAIVVLMIDFKVVKIECRYL